MYPLLPTLPPLPLMTGEHTTSAASTEEAIAALNKRKNFTTNTFALVQFVPTKCKLT